MPERQLQVDFDCNDRNVTMHVWLAFWESIRPWLAERGYTLFEYGYHWGDRYVGEVTYLAPKLNDTLPSNEHPFSKCGGDVEGMPAPALSADWVVRVLVLHLSTTLIQFKERISFAQDSLKHHVALRLIKKSSQEYQIAQLLNNESSLQSLERFEGVIPTLDLLDIADHCIMVMPRYYIDCSVIDRLLMYHIVDGVSPQFSLGSRPSEKLYITCVTGLK